MSREGKKRRGGQKRIIVNDKKEMRRENETRRRGLERKGETDKVKRLANDKRKK